MLDIVELSDGERERRKEVRMLEKETDWKRVVRMLTDERLVIESRLLIEVRGWMMEDG